MTVQDKKAAVSCPISASSLQVLFQSLLVLLCTTLTVYIRPNPINLTISFYTLHIRFHPSLPHSLLKFFSIEFFKIGYIGYATYDSCYDWNY